MLRREVEEVSEELREMPVQPQPCQTCPFAGKSPVDLTPGRYAELVGNLVSGQGQHLCHSVNNEKICRGGREIQLRAFCAMGLIGAPTDAAFNAAMDEVLGR